MVQMACTLCHRGVTTGQLNPATQAVAKSIQPDHFVFSFGIGKKNVFFFFFERRYQGALETNLISCKSKSRPPLSPPLNEPLRYPAADWLPGCQAASSDWVKRRPNLVETH